MSRADKDVDVDRALAVAGGYKRWSITLYILIGLSCYTTLAWQKLSIVFTGWIPPHHCKVPENTTVHSVIPEIENGTLQSCHMYGGLGDNRSLISCSEGWTYYTDGEHTVVTEWDLVCDKDSVSDISQSVYGAGELTGELISALVVDRIGRRRSHMASLLLVVILGTTIAFVQSYYVFIVLRFFVALCTVCLVSAGFTLAIELFDSKRRTVIGEFMGYLWSTGYLTLVLIAYFVRDWRTFYLVISLTPLVFIIYIFILPESPFWLVVNGKLEEAERTLQRLAKWNGIMVTQSLLRKPKQSQNFLEETFSRNAPDTYHSSIIYSADKRNSYIELEEQKKPLDVGERTGTLRDLFRDATLRKHTIIASTFWFANGVIYYAIVLSVATFSGDRYLNFAIMGLTEPISFFVAYLCARKSRRISTCVFLCGSAIFLVLTAVVDIIARQVGTDLGVVTTVLSIIAKFCVATSFCVIVLYAGEIFPTNLRGTSGGLCRIAAGCGNISAPFLAYAARKMSWLPNIIEAAIAITAGLLVLALPETANTPLPQTIDDVYALYKKPKSEENIQQTANLPPHARRVRTL